MLMMMIMRSRIRREAILSRVNTTNANIFNFAISIRCSFHMLDKFSSRQSPFDGVGEFIDWKIRLSVCNCNQCFSITSPCCKSVICTRNKLRQLCTNFSTSLLS